jgi:hypothetical protein
MGRVLAAICARPRGVAALTSAVVACGMAAGCGLDWTVPPEAQDPSTASPDGDGSGAAGGAGAAGGGTATAGPGSGGDAAAGASTSSSSSAAASGGGAAQGSGGALACADEADSSDCDYTKGADDCGWCAMTVPCSLAMAECDSDCPGAASCHGNCGDQGCAAGCYAAWVDSCPAGACPLLWLCLDACDEGDQACYGACDLAHAGGIAAYDKAMTCIICGNCAGSFAAEYPATFQSWCCV